MSRNPSLRIDLELVPQHPDPGGGPPPVVGGARERGSLKRDGERGRVGGMERKEIA